MTEQRGRQIDWSIGEVMEGKMFVGGPRLAKHCPACNSPNVNAWTDWRGEHLKCDDCRATFGGASARA